MGGGVSAGDLGPLSGDSQDGPCGKIAGPLTGPGYPGISGPANPISAGPPCPAARPLIQSAA